MTIAKKINEEIMKMPEGNTFKYQEVSIGREEYAAATKAIERLIKSGIIKREHQQVCFLNPRIPWSDF